MSEFKTQINIQNIFHLKNLEHPHRAHKLLDSALSGLTVSKKAVDLPPYLWPAERFRLHQSRLWRQLGPDQQTQALILLSQRNLASSWWIENSGRTYGSKMILLAESHEEKSLHALFTAEESIHMREFENFMDFNLDWNLHSHPMLEPLAQVISEGERETLLLVVQVLLEGFGLAHYQGLRDDCLFPDLVKAYDRILKDEARHHGTGVIFAQEMSPNQECKNQMVEFSRAFINSFMNVSWIQTAIESQYGPLSKKEIKELDEDLMTQEICHLRKMRFKDMIAKVDRFNLVKKLEEEKVF